MGDKSDHGSGSQVEDFDWLKYRDVENEDNALSRNVMRNPIVPLGVVATTIILGLGLRTVVTGDSKLSQKMMRARVGAQGFTLVAMVAGFIYHASKST